MSHRRLCARTPSACKIGVGVLERHRLCFHKVGKDGSAKCDAFETGNIEDMIYGVVFNLHADEKHLLDEAEGLGNGYEIKYADITMQNGGVIMAFTYFATSVDKSLKPLDWYKYHVMQGMSEHDLPAWYQQSMNDIACIKDEDQYRKTGELAIYQ